MDQRLGRPFRAMGSTNFVPRATAMLAPLALPLPWADIWLPLWGETTSRCKRAFGRALSTLVALSIQAPDTASVPRAGGHLNT